MTPAEIDQSRKVATALMQSDYSPVGHWTQGLGRVADNVLGALQMREAEKATEANAERSSQLARYIGEGQATDADLAEAQGDAYADPVVRALAQATAQQWQEANQPQYFSAGEAQEREAISGLKGDPTTHAHAERRRRAVQGDGAAHGVVGPRRPASTQGGSERAGGETARGRAACQSQ